MERDGHGDGSGRPGRLVASKRIGQRAIYQPTPNTRWLGEHTESSWLLSSGLRVSIFRCLEPFLDAWLTHTMFRGDGFCREARGT